VKIKLSYYGQSPPSSRIVEVQPGQLVRYRTVGSIPNDGFEKVGLVVEIGEIGEPVRDIEIHILGESGLEKIPRSHLYSIGAVQSAPGEV
jgi:hypothetical protein